MSCLSNTQSGKKNGKSLFNASKAAATHTSGSNQMDIN